MLAADRRDADTTGGCEWPVRITRADGSTLAVRCKSRKSSWCRACARIARAQACRIALSGISDLDAAKGEAVLFVTLTPPGSELLGCPVHFRDRRGSRPCRCGRWHANNDPLLGVPLNSRRFNYEAAAAWNEGVSALWSATIYQIRKELGITHKDRDQLQYMKVLEYHKSGLVHAHVLMRGKLLGKTQAVLRAIKRAQTDLIITDGISVSVGWGRQLDIREFAQHKKRELERVAMYCAGYISKSAAGDLFLDSKARVAHYLRIAEIAQDRYRDLAKEPSVRVAKNVFGQLGHRGFVMSYSHAWGLSYRRIRAEARKLFKSLRGDTVAMLVRLDVGYRTGEVAAEVAADHDNGRPPPIKSLYEAARIHGIWIRKPRTTCELEAGLAF